MRRALMVKRNISRFSDGLTLLRMVAFAFMKLKAL